ncbi:Methylenetetrahydrofolate--tRNA-(uracil-5-)-methyltransferase TrmFO [Methylobacterium cerastii]|uniref:Methylenetetrahydrofolate--tRNA-(uracil-5-)-methyltransferase TrmFO n=1 Tax=Methylobacterium cerastii TaxID=932741 RepID=A0ABQ4QF60_9HYPH|nr:MULTISPECIES: methylenetetrahydrofolate--tRNA-(uracil(54)-C(5))-methyltransferase (FADH(2)-oxidizing) TrmFO [Methylobacterium]TXM73650.1 methylenetetrahydrofolate--tRNA-(uracil(54)-C(5))-methyltransferase (FADH(2)-oxidizing) TrmFO [Methylobacterium sp. WL12]TXN76994.1 methylenetetrahydrofolate--tRNA-(uracil(54)-C(5))-methyltransferase (FADH(2)-oxidizing) TrmFO [Methylobacterium sp. WL8]GJD43505.1 Methylenetetrahydrofolate--tRNA-(uracil-5-)-methyltransferase TrmFO [Methylobacterium cerastii]
MSSSRNTIHVVGGGLAGSESAWQIAEAGHHAVLHEMRPVRGTEAHHGEGLAELVCSNSFRSDDPNGNAVGLLHQEMRTLGSLILRAADRHQVPAGGALAVDRDGFSAAVTAALEAHPNVTIVREEVAGLPPEAWGPCIVATGPLTAPSLAEGIRAITGADALAFFDAIAPIVHRDSIDMDKAWFQSRYDKVGPGGTGADYINCPMDRAQYEAFIQALVDGEKIGFKEWEASTPYFDGCLPIEVMAERGAETLRHGPMKPVGLTNPHDPQVKACAIVQLRQDNALGTLYNMVGFQTKLTYSEQVRVFRTIPGLENAEFARLGGLHRNTYLDSPRLLDATLRLKVRPSLRFAGQITGCEGYVESAAIGLMAGRFAVAEAEGRALEPLPQTTALGALIAHITGGHILDDVPEEPGEETAEALVKAPAKPRSFQPMNVNFGLFPPLAAMPRNETGKRLRGPEKAMLKRQALTDRARADLSAWIAGTVPQAAAAE